MRGVLTVLVVMLSACGRPEPVSAPETLQQTRDVVTFAPNFSDADPYDWTTRRPSDYAVHGIDLSRWQSSVDWPLARQSGVNFAFIKATEGGDILDPLYETHRRDASAAGVPHGAYHFFYWCTPAEVQAQWFIRNVPRAPGQLPPVLDVEWNAHSPTCQTRPSPMTVRREIAIFQNLLARHYGQRPVIYTNIGFWEDNNLARLTGEEFWLRSTAAHPSEAYHTSRWSFWQYSGTGLVPGISGQVDLNVFAGSSSAWSEWLARRRQ